MSSVSDNDKKTFKNLFDYYDVEKHKELKNNEI